MYTITTPNKNFAGERAGVTFAKGHGETDDQAAALVLVGLGYTVDPDPAEQPEDPAPTGKKAPAKPEGEQQ